MEIIRERIRERRKIIEEAKEWASELHFKVTAVLVGSYARGDFNKWSDVDIILITDEIKGNPLERLKNINIPPGYEVIIWTPQEFEIMIKKKNQLALEAVSKGITLRDDYNIVNSSRVRSIST